MNPHEPYTGPWYEVEDERRLCLADPGRAARLAAYKNGGKNTDVPCVNCEGTPTVHPTDLCGPCCFGEADTINGNW